MWNRLEEAKSVAQDAMLEGRRAAAINILLAEGCTLVEAVRMTDPPRLPQVGDILVCSWGYDQTNIDYYQVVGVTKASVKIREIGKVYHESDSRTQDLLTPAINRFDPEAKVLTRRFRLLNDYAGSRYSCNVSDFQYATLWDGEADYQTGAAYGH